MTHETLFIGLILAVLYVEFFEIYPGGIIVPGYIALAVRQPLSIAATLAVALLTFVIIAGLRHLIILYGKRMFLASVMIGFFLTWCAELWILDSIGPSSGLRIIGFIIPGLIANEMQKQDVFRTLTSLVIVSGTVAVLLHAYRSVSR